MDAERVLVDYLNSSGVGATAYYDVPADRPPEMVVCELSGGPESDIVVRNPLFDIQCWSSTRRGAALLADEVKRALARMPGILPNAFRVNVTSTYRDREMESGSPRYHVVAEIVFNE